MTCVCRWPFDGDELSLGWSHAEASFHSAEEPRGGELSLGWSHVEASFHSAEEPRRGELSLGRSHAKQAFTRLESFVYKNAPLTHSKGALLGDVVWVFL